MKTGKILEKFESKNFSKIYFLETEEDEFQNEFLRGLKKKISYPELNYSIHYGGELESTEFFHSLFSLPFLSQLKIIVVKNASEIPEKIITQLDKNLDRIPSTNSLILSDSKVSAALKKIAPNKDDIICLGKLTKPQIKAWVLKRMKEENKRINSDALSLLLENTGANFSLITRELDKLIAYTGNKQIIETKDIKDIGIDAETYNIFELIDNISKKNTYRSLNILRGLLFSKTSPQQIIGMLRTQFTRLWEAKALIAKGVSGYKAMEKVKVPYFKRNEFASHMKTFKWEQIRKTLNLLLDTDIRIKTGGEPNLSMELLVIKITK